MEIFKDHGCNWAYDAFRGWRGWRVEHSAERETTKPLAQPACREKLLLECFADNREAGMVSASCSATHVCRCGATAFVATAGKFRWGQCNCVEGCR